MNSEVFQDTLSWLHKKQRRDHSQTADRRRELKDLTFRVSKRLQGTWGTEIGEKYRQLKLDSALLQPQHTNERVRSTKKKKKKKKTFRSRRSYRKNKVSLSALSLEFSASKKRSVEFPVEGSASLYASKNLGYIPQIFPNVDLKNIASDGRPLPHARLKKQSCTRAVHRWFPSGPATWTPLPDEKKKNFYGPYNSETLKIVSKLPGKKRKKKAKSKYLIYDNNGVIDTDLHRQRQNTSLSSNNLIGQRLLMRARERRGSLQVTYDKLNNAAISITKFFRNGKGIVQVWKWREQIQHALWIKYNATIINSKFARSYLARKNVKELRFMHMQALKIQNAQRALVARRRVFYLKSLDRARRKFRERMIIKRSARIVQKAVKNHAKKKILRRFLAGKVTSLQKRARGWLTRKRFAKKKEKEKRKGAIQRAKETAAAAKHYIQHVFYRRGGNDKQTTKIQSAMRGYLSRRRIQQMKIDKEGYEYMHPNVTVKLSVGGKVTQKNQLDV